MSSLLDEARTALKSHGKRALYQSGALDAWHRRRNWRHLTVVMFHRVLPPEDPRWASRDPEYTLSDRLFGECLVFFRRHYEVVSLAQVLTARAGGLALPDLPLLITFDDGWSDTEEYALPRLRRAGLPAVLFCVGQAVDRAAPFWQEQMIHAWRAGRLDAAAAAKAWSMVSSEPAPRFGNAEHLGALRHLIARLERSDPELRQRAVASLEAALADATRYMCTAAQLERLADGGVAIGLHGHSHTPLVEVDAAAELEAARAALGRAVEVAPVMSFPHGRFDDGAILGARRAGCELLFTSVPELPSARGHGPGLLGRVGFTDDDISEDGVFAPEKLALHLFRRPRAG